MDRCDECGFEYDLAKAPAAGATILAGVRELVQMLSQGSPAVAARREPQTWSPLEYGCHLRDVLLVQRERVLQARREDRSTFVVMGRDERVEHDGYAEQQVDDVARQLSDAALLFANAVSRLRPEDWERTAIYPFPAPTERSLRWVAAHSAHEVQHHSLDVRRQLP